MKHYGKKREDLSSRPSNPVLRGGKRQTTPKAARRPCSKCGPPNANTRISAQPDANCWEFKKRQAKEANLKNVERRSQPKKRHEHQHRPALNSDAQPTGPFTSGGAHHA